MEYKYHIRRLLQPSADTVVLELADRSGGPVFDFRPGQYVMISYINRKGRLERKHAFSLASSPTDMGSITLGIRLGGEFTRGLLGLGQGDQVLVNGPFGSFVFDEHKHKDLVFLAGGIGITPFYSAMRYATDKQLPNKLTLLYSNRSLDNTLFFREIKDLESKNQNLRALFSVTDKNVLPLAGGVINRRLDTQMIRESIGGIEGKTFFICGPSGFMTAMKANLSALGVDPSRVETEGFSMIVGAGLLSGTRNTAYALGFSGALMLAAFYMIANPDQPVTADQNKLGLASSLLGESPAASSAPAVAVESRDGIPVVLADTSAATPGTTTAADQAVVPSGSAQASKPASSDARTAKTPITAKQPSSVAKAPAPATHVSAVQETAKPVAPVVNTQTAPAPTTSVSGTAPAQTQTAQAAPSAAPTPITSASSVTSGTAASGATAQPAASAPAPVTSASTATTATSPAAGTGAPTSNTTGSRRFHDDDD